MLNIAVIVALALSAAAQAKHTHDGGPFIPQGQSTPGAVSTPYRQLFLVSAIPQTVKDQTKEQAEALRAARARMVHHSRPSLFEEGPCGMPVIVARPEVDPKMIVTVPESARGSAKIRAIEPPPPCGEK